MLAVTHTAIDRLFAIESSNIIVQGDLFKVSNKNNVNNLFQVSEKDRKESIELGLAGGFVVNFKLSFHTILVFLLTTLSW